MVKNLLAMQETRVQSLGWEDPLEKGTAIHSSILAWRIPWTEKPCGLQSVGLQRARHDWATSTCTLINSWFMILVTLYLLQGRVGQRLGRRGKVWWFVQWYRGVRYLGLGNGVSPKEKGYIQAGPLLDKSSSSWWVLAICCKSWTFMW